MNKKRFLNRQVFLTAVVDDSPVKAKVPPIQVSADPTNSLLHSHGLVDQGTGAISKLPPAELLLSRPVSASKSSDSLQGFVFGLVSPVVQDKIDNLEGLKRKYEGSPEGDLMTRKEKKLLKSEEKKKKKLEIKENKKLQMTRAT